MIKNLNQLKPSAVVMAGLLLLAYSSVARPDFDQIQKLIAEDKLEQALNLTNKELTEDKENVTYRFLKGLILTRQEKLEQARDIFLGIIKSNPELPEPYNNLAVVYAAMGDFDKAKNSLEEAINTHPSYATAHENIGDIYAKLASQAYNQALELDRDNNAAKAKLSLVNELFSMPQAGQQPVMLAGATDTRPAVLLPEPVVEAAQAVETLQPEAQDVKNNELLAKVQEAERQSRIQEGQKLVAIVKQSVLDWSVAWSAQNINAYLSAYASDFSPPGVQSLDEWRLSRQQRLNNPGSIQVTISDLVVEMLGSDHAQATFTQIYQSDIYSDRVKKTLLLKRESNKWLITRELTS